MMRIISLLFLTALLFVSTPLFAKHERPTHPHKKHVRKHHAHYKNHHKGHLKRDPYPAATIREPQTRS